MGCLGKMRKRTINLVVFLWLLGLCFGNGDVVQNSVQIEADRGNSTQWEVEGRNIVVIGINSSDSEVNGEEMKIKLPENGRNVKIGPPPHIRLMLPVFPTNNSQPPQTSSVPSSSNSDNQAREMTLDLARRLETRLKAIRMDEMCIAEIQEMFDSMEFVPVTRNDEEMLRKMAEKLDKKLDNIVSVLLKMRRFIVDLDQRPTQGGTVVYPCTARRRTQAKIISYNKDQIEILNNNSNLTNPLLNGPMTNSLDFGEALYREMKRSSHKNSSAALVNFKRQFFLSPHDNAIDNSCPFYFDSQIFREIFVSSVENKKVLILLDHGNSLNADQLELTKSMAKNVINLLSDSDMVNIIAISDRVMPFLHQTITAKSVQSKSCQPNSNININSSSTSDSNKWKMHQATLDNKLIFHKYIDGLNKTKEHTNHSLGFKVAFDFIGKELDNDTESDLIFLYISRGLLSLAEAKTVLETIAMGQSRLKKPIVINTCAVIIDEKRIMYERQFLRDITVQDYEKYKIEAPWRKGVDYSLEGSIFSASKKQSEEIYVNATALFSRYFLSRPKIDENMFLNPTYMDEENKDLIVSITQSVGNFGIFGIDLYLQDLAEDVIYYNKHPDSYAFLVTYEGIVLVHPMQINRSLSKGVQYSTDILLLEQNQFFDHELRNRILTQEMDRVDFVDQKNNGTVSYSWRRTKHNLFIICIVTKKSYSGSRAPVQLKRISGIHYYSHQFNDAFLYNNRTPDVLYHRLDLMTSVLKNSKTSPGEGKKLTSLSSGKVALCRNFKQISTFDSGTLYLSPSAFQSPFLFTKNNRDSNEDLALDRIQTLMAYLKDRTNLLANPGLLPQIRNDVVALSYIINHLKSKHQKEGPLKKYIIRRYVATMNGVLQVFPGLQLDANLEPMQRPWFIKAMTYPGKIVITEPYLDAGGAGYIISIAYTIFEGKPNALHNPKRDTPIAVLAIDFTIGFFYKMLLEANNICTMSNIKCFLIDDKGYLVAHPNVMEPITNSIDNESRRPLEHITHRESFVANDILNHKVLVQKRLCNVYPNRTTQRYYQFNTSISEVLTNIVHGEKSKYHITVVPGTNVFLTVLNSSNDGGAFCPCSTVDRLCLNCNRMEQTECECPCECPIPEISTKRFLRGYEEDSCQKNETITKYNCDLPSLNFEEFELNTLMPIFRYDFDEIDLKSCSNPSCDFFSTQLDCLGVIGCEWCQVDVDGETVFNQPFCTAQSSCFNGVLGSITPYGLDIVDNQLGATIFIDPLTPPTYSSIGPIAGAIIALCLVIGFAMYCYRQNQDPHQNHNFDENFYIDSTMDNNFDVPMNRMNYEDNFDDHNDGNNSNQNLLPVNSGIVRPEISPYRAPSAYRRPNGDSDHGYSTMTPHDDSENLCFTLADPLLNAQKRASISDSASINTSVSSPTNFQKHYNVPLDNKTIASNSMDLRDTGALFSSPAATSSPHHVLAPVTVHRQMEAS